MSLDDGPANRDPRLPGHNLGSDGTVAMSHPRRFSIRRLTSADVTLMKVMLTIFGEAWHLYGRAHYLESLLGSKHFIAHAAARPLPKRSN
jgi:hypothetical protein